MLAGHFGLAAMVKAREPQVPLWSLMLATSLLDIVFLGTYAAGLEGFSSATGGGLGYGELHIDAPYSHSLIGALAISLVALIVAGIAWGRRNGLVIGFVVFSHWLLDLLVHRPDMPILPGNAGDLPLLGLGLWMVPWLSAFVELCLVLAGAYMYYHAAMRSAVRAERADAKAGSAAAVASGGYRQQALLSSVVMFVLLLGTLAVNFFLGA
ncbi:MAG: permease [Chloroflexota bacterium]|nr:permease [Chloroflexota bacterium]MDQ5867297.1 permease [Chloroflexota bacterium]